MEVLRLHRFFALTAFLYVVLPAVLFVSFIAKSYEIPATIQITQKPSTEQACVGLQTLLGNQSAFLVSDRVLNRANEFVHEYVTHNGHCETCEEIAPDLFINKATHQYRYPALSADFSEYRHYAKWFKESIKIDKNENATSTLTVRFAGEGSPKDLTTVFSLYLAAYKYEQAKDNNHVEVSIIERPKIPIAPIKPDVPKIIAASMLLGLFFATVLVKLRAAMDITLHWPSQLETILKEIFKNDQSKFESIGIYVLPKCDENEPPKVLENVSPSIPEPFKRVGLALEQSGCSNIGLLNVTPYKDVAVPPVLLSVYLAAMGNETVLIDADSGPLSLTKYLTKKDLMKPANKGFLDFLNQDVIDLKTLFQPIARISKHYFIPVGQMQEGEFAFSRENLENLTAEFSSSQHRFMLFSLPSMVYTFDSVALVRNLDGVVLIVHPDKTNLDHFRATVSELEASKTKILAILVQPPLKAKT